MSSKTRGQTADHVKGFFMSGNLVERQEDGVIVGNEPKFWGTVS